jgi:hypothetical protein
MLDFSVYVIMLMIFCTVNHSSSVAVTLPYFNQNPVFFLFYQWLRHYATTQKVAGSSPDEVVFFNSPNPSDRIMALGSTQPLTEMSTRNL